ncbi:MAG: 3-isopropylmalate/3-methylmalate dehydrogenase [Candidatus Thorarchaeota archaeon AB_25]|nr:MAG: 3-isopropylmalate/3-methylmalate dehydrogenase [Candidatus Thorarchaeota archaeon AB_25]
MGRTYKIAVLPGDGIGREVIPEARRVMVEAFGTSELIDLEFHEFECGGEYFLKTGNEWSEEAEVFTKTEADAILLGGIGAKGPDGNTVRRPDGNLAGYSVVIGLRQELDLYANVRPVKLYEGVPTPLAGKGPSDIDMVIVRENTEGLYYPARGRFSEPDRNFAYDLRMITAKASERIARFAYDLAKDRNGAPVDKVKRVTCVDKSNLLAGCQLFREIFDKIGEKYKGVTKDYAYVDAWTLLVVRKPEYYDVVVAPNAFGDIISDLGGALVGGLGMIPSGNIGDKHAVFEPVHGSAPDIAGTGQANPIAALLSTAMMLEWLGKKFEDKGPVKTAGRIRGAIEEVLREGKIRTQDLCLGEWAGVKPSMTQQVTDEIIRKMKG